jgi:archaellum component FlaC
MRGFQGMTRKVEDKVYALVHSVHYTNRPHVKVFLVHQENYESAIEQFRTIHLDLLAGAPQEFQGNVFVEGMEAGLSSGHRDTIHSCNSSLHASELLQLHNPQDAEVEVRDNPQKRFKPTIISYTAAVTPPVQATEMVSDPSPTSTQQSSNISSLTDHDLEQLYERMKQHVVITDSESQGISTDELEKMVAESNNQIDQVREELRASVSELSTQVKKQNVVVLGVQRTLESTSSELKNIMNEKVSDLAGQISELRSLIQTLLPPPALQAVEQSEGQGAP